LRKSGSKRVSIVGDAEPSPTDSGCINPYQALHAWRRCDRDQRHLHIVPFVAHFRSDSLEKHAPVGPITQLAGIRLKSDDRTDGCSIEFRARYGAKQDGLLK
jgi:hypothetical protein